MRLICPNCEAQYEVADNAIPDEGRDVQCSSCGHTWFQLHPDQEAQIAATREAIGAENGWDLDEDTAKPAATPATKPRPFAVAGDAPQPVPEQPAAQPAAQAPFMDVDEDEDFRPVATASPPAAAPRPQQKDDRVMEVLRAEAQREQQVRAAERSPLESQPDLGLRDEPKPASAEAAAAVSIAQSAPRNSAPRREALPNVDEINSTLRSTSERRPYEEESGYEEMDTESRGGFGRGLIWALALILLLAVLYFMAPAIAEAIPSLQPSMSAYVGAIDGLWGWLLAQVGSLTGTLDGMSSEAQG